MGIHNNTFQKPLKFSFNDEKSDKDIHNFLGKNYGNESPRSSDNIRYSHSGNNNNSDNSINTNSNIGPNVNSSRGIWTPS